LQHLKHWSRLCNSLLPLPLPAHWQYKFNELPPAVLLLLVGPEPVEFRRSIEQIFNFKLKPARALTLAPLERPPSWLQVGETPLAVPVAVHWQALAPLQLASARHW
jgi:hypothetical protein